MVPRLAMPRRKVTRSSLVVLLLVLSSAGAPSAQDEKNKAASPSAIAGKITGRVVLAAGEQAVAGAEVRMSEFRDPYLARKESLRRATTNAQGEFTFDNVAPGRYRLLSLQGNLVSRTRRHQHEMVEVAADGTTKPVVLKMQSGIALRVKLLSEVTGQPIQNARIELWQSDIGRDHATDAKGEVELRGLTAERWEVRALAKDHAAVNRGLNLANEQVLTLEMRLPPGGSVQGRVQDEKGQPLAGVGVFASPVERRPEEFNLTLDRVQTDAEGRYRLDHLPLGRQLELGLRKAEYVLERKTVTIDPKGNSTLFFDVALKKQLSGGSVQGIVTDLKGKPIVGAEVARRGSNDVRQVKTDEQGRFRFDNVRENELPFGLPQGFRVGDPAIEVRAQGFSPHRVEFKPGPANQPTEVVVKLEPGHFIKGCVLDEAGKPIAGAQVRCRAEARSRSVSYTSFAKTDAQGRFQFDSMPTNVRFDITADGYSGTSYLALPLDDVNERIVTLSRPGLLKGRVVDATTGKPIARFQVRLSPSRLREPDDPRGVPLNSLGGEFEESFSLGSRGRSRDRLACRH